jgi:hypothetical protein
MFEDFRIRLQREIQANAKKAALLGVLVLFGCSIWVPMLMRTCASARSFAGVNHGTVPQTAMTTLPRSAGAPVTASHPMTSEFWSKLTATLAEDSMFQSADVQSLNRNPFQLVEIPEPLPVLFADEPVQAEPVTSIAAEDARRLELRSTIIGRTRRAAMINGQLYQLGRQFQADGRQYQLTSIESHRVVLSSGEQTIELTLARPQLKDVLNRDKALGSSAP